MEPGSFEEFLTHFGITQSHVGQNRYKWTISILSDGDEFQPRSAYFDREHGQWKLDNPTNGHQLDAQSVQETVIQKNKPNSLLNTADWTKALYPSDHLDFFNNQNWAITPLGHCSTWSHSLRLYTHMLFSDKRAAAMYWGPKRIAIYNEAMVPVAGDLHPLMMGRSFEDIMPSIWDFFSPLFHAIENDKHGFTQNSLELLIMRNGFLEETWWDGSVVPLKDDSGNHGGAYFSYVEVTRTTLQDRRTVLLNRLRHLSLADSTTIWQKIHDVFADFPRDIPMAIIYSADEAKQQDGSLYLETTIGIGSAYTAAPMNLNSSLNDTDSVLVPLLSSARESSSEFIVIDLSKETAHQKVLENVDWQGFGEPSRHLVIIPLRAKEQIKGYVTLGLNPRGKLDADHEQFIADLARQLTGLVARVTNEEQTQKRENTLMTELSDTEKRINRLAEIVPVGIYEQAANGSVLWCNKQFFDILGVPHDQRDVRIFDWRDYIIPEDISRAGEDMGRCLSAAVELSGSVRLRRHYQPPRIGHDSQPDEEPFWIMYSASPDVRADGTVQSLMGCLADISHLKWTEQVHIRNAEQARRDRKRQEEFIDITSHEMRNPLSAITQCADSVILSLQDAKTTSTAQSLIELIKLNAEAAESILFCAAHQRRIIDDVLTLGKLDSRLLTIFPTPFHPSNLIDQALQMFKTEIEVNAIDVQISLDDTRALAGTPLVYGDTSRLMQILVNLLTNAIKFTRTQQVRHITIRYGSSQDIPSADRFAPGFEWHSTGITHPDLTLESDYGQGEAVYLYYAVIDSGTGVPPGFIEKVFSKFEQADRRTHTKYGGSGLGLYISRELAEMQGGHIGISSIDGVGSTFAFYTKARCAEVQPIGQVELVTRSRSVTKATQASGAQILERCSFPTSLPPPINYNILLVEDNLLNQKVLAKQLKIAGCAVQVSDNGGEAIDAVLRIHKQPVEFGTLPSSEENTLPYFDCILMDWEMPVCDGLRATKRIREIETQHGSGKNIIIGVTANARAEQIAVAMKAGMDTVMPKPFRVAELLAKIGELVAL